MVIKVQDGKIEEFFQKSIEEQRFNYFYKRRYIDDCYLRLSETEKNVVLSKTWKSIVFSGDHFFTKTEEDGVFIFNKLDRKVKRNTFSKEAIFEALTHFPQFDWLEESRKRRGLFATLFCDSIVRDVLLGKLTNAEKIVKKYLSLNGIKNADWKIFSCYLKCANRYPIYWLQGHTTNINAAMEVLIMRDPYVNIQKPTTEQKEKGCIFGDMLKEAFALNVKINPMWSLNRMKEEHANMTRELMRKDLEKKKQVDIYGVCPQFDYPCKLLSTEREVFNEGMEMHHCVYTCYWDQIQTRRYLAFSFDATERFTLGLKLTEDGWVYDQAYLKYDKQINDESKTLIEQFLSDSNVSTTLCRLTDKGLVPDAGIINTNTLLNDDAWLDRIDV